LILIAVGAVLALAVHVATSAGRQFVSDMTREVKIRGSSLFRSGGFPPTWKSIRETNKRGLSAQLGNKRVGAALALLPLPEVRPPSITDVRGAESMSAHIFRTLYHRAQPTREKQRLAPRGETPRSHNVRAPTAV
jgi:hypothetical protein